MPEPIRSPRSCGIVDVCHVKREELADRSAIAMVAAKGGGDVECRDSEAGPHFKDVLRLQHPDELIECAPIAGIGAMRQVVTAEDGYEVCLRPAPLGLERGRVEDP